MYRKVLQLLLVVLGSLCMTGCARDESLPQARGNAPDFNGIWQIVSYESVVRPEMEVDRMTDEGRRRLDYWNGVFAKGSKSPNDLCAFVGMPWTMLTRARDYATEIYQTKDRMMLFHEGMDLVRHTTCSAANMRKYWSAGNCSTPPGRPRRFRLTLP
jgi:hypothetical protein